MEDMVARLVVRLLDFQSHILCLNLGNQATDLLTSEVPAHELQYCQTHCDLFMFSALRRPGRRGMSS